VFSHAASYKVILNFVLLSFGSSILTTTQKNEQIQPENKSFGDGLLRVKMGRGIRGHEGRVGRGGMESGGRRCAYPTLQFNKKISLRH
jgi:hypothetical protein